MNIIKPIQGSEEFALYPKRYLIIFLFTLIQFMTAILVNTLTPIASYLSVIYDKEPTVINLGSLLFILMHPIFTFPAAYVIDTYGTRLGIILGSGLCLIGVGLRLLVNHGFFLVILGQVVAGIGRPFILNSQTKIAANWFDAKTRGAVTQFLTLVLNLSLVVGIFIPGLVFGSYQPDLSSPQSIEEGKSLTFQVMLVQMIMALCCYVPNMILQQDKPPTAPSDSGNVMREEFKVALPKLFTNKNYVFLWITFGCYFGIFNGLCIILAFLLQPWFGGQDLPLAVACVGGAPIFSGILGTIVFGQLQRKYGQFKRWIMLCMVGSCIAVAVFYPLLQTNSLALASLISAANSFFLFPLVPFMLQFSCEIAFPVGQATATGFLFANGNFCGFLMGICLSFIVQGQTKGQSAGGLGFCFAIFLVGLILTYFMKEENNRENYENEAQEKRRSSSASNTSKDKKQESSDSSKTESIKSESVASAPAELEIGLLVAEGGEITESLL